MNDSYILVKMHMKQHYLLLRGYITNCNLYNHQRWKLKSIHKEASHYFPEIYDNIILQFYSVSNLMMISSAYLWKESETESSLSHTIVGLTASVYITRIMFYANQCLIVWCTIPFLFFDHFSELCKHSLWNKILGALISLPSKMN